jgi:hypothetical protein
MKQQSIIIPIIILLQNFSFISKVLCIRVENLNDIAKDSTSITIKWTTSQSTSLTSGTNTDVNGWVGYKIKYSRDDDNDKAITLNYLNNLNENTYRVEKLLPFTSYKIQVSAYKAVNNEEGPSSNLIYVRTTEAGNFYDLKFDSFSCYCCFF